MNAAPISTLVSVLPRSPKIDDGESKKKEDLHKCFIEKHANAADKFFSGEGDLGWLGIVLDVVLFGIPIGIVKLKEMVNQAEYGKEIKAEELVKKRGLDPTQGEGKELGDTLKALTEKKVDEMDRVETNLRSAITTNQNLLFARGSKNEIPLIVDPETQKDVHVRHGALCAYDNSGSPTEIMSRQDFFVYCVHHKLISNDLSCADLSGLDLSGLDMTGFVLDDTNCIGTKFEGTTLTDVNFNKAMFDKTTNFKKAILNNASFVMADDLSGVNFKNAQMQNVRGMVGRDMSKANLKGADLTGTNIDGMKIREAKLKGVKGVDNWQIADGWREANFGNGVAPRGYYTPGFGGDTARKPGNNSQPSWLADLRKEKSGPTDNKPLLPQKRGQSPTTYPAKPVVISRYDDPDPQSSPKGFSSAYHDPNYTPPPKNVISAYVDEQFTPPE